MASSQRCLQRAAWLRLSPTPSFPPQELALKVEFLTCVPIHPLPMPGGCCWTVLSGQNPPEIMPAKQTPFSDSGHCAQATRTALSWGRDSRTDQLSPTPFPQQTLAGPNLGLAPSCLLTRPGRLSASALLHRPGRLARCQGPAPGSRQWPPGEGRGQSPERLAALGAASR